MSRKKEWKKIVIQTGKIAVGSSAAIYIAQTLGLENAASAGTITLLTIVTTKRETLKLSAYRLITFAVSVLLAAMTIGCLESVWIAYAVYIFAVIFICQMFGWQATISVNSPDEQIARLEEIFADMKKEPLPESREEFEARAVLYHILMDIEEFLLFKKRFAESLDEKKLERYWKKDKETGPDVK